MVSIVRATATGIGAGGPLPAGSIVAFDWGDRSGASEVGGTVHSALHTYMTDGTFRIRARAFTRGGALIGGPGFTTYDTSTSRITQLTPATGPADGGTEVFVDGVNLAEALYVFFGSGQATGLQIVSPNRLRCLSPPGSGGVLVSVLAPAATNQLPFVYTGGEEEPDGD